MNKSKFLKESKKVYIEINSEDIVLKYDDKFFIVLNGKNIEVSQSIFENYKHLCWKYEYNEKKHSNSTSLGIYGYTDHLEYICLDSNKTLEDIVIDKITVEKIMNIASKHQNGSYIIKKLLQGYCNTRIAEEMGISPQLFSFQKNTLFNEIRKEIKENYF